MPDPLPDLSLLRSVTLCDVMPCHVVCQTLGADWLVASGHKMCGPTGIGFLWGRMSVLETMRPWQVREGQGECALRRCSPVFLSSVS